MYMLGFATLGDSSVFSKPEDPFKVIANLKNL
jgi:hypothetical protein